MGLGSQGGVTSLMEVSCGPGPHTRAWVSPRFPHTQGSGHRIQSCPGLGSQAEAPPSMATTCQTGALGSATQWTGRQFPHMWELLNSKAWLEAREGGFQEATPPTAA